MGTWRWNLRDEHIWGDAAFLDLWGFPPSDDPRRLSDFADRMSLQGRVEMREMITRAVAAGEEFDGQLAIVSGPTEGRWVRWRGRAEREQPWLVNGVSFDVTAQRLADERLRASEERYRAFVTASSDAVYRMSPDWSQMRQLDGRGFLVDTGEPDENWIEPTSWPRTVLTSWRPSKPPYETSGRSSWNTGSAAPTAAWAGRCRGPCRSSRKATPLPSGLVPPRT